MTVNLILLLIGIVEPILAASGVIPSNYQGLATGILNAITALKAQLTNANGQLDVTSVSLIYAINAGVQQLAAANVLGAGSGIAKALSGAVAAGEADMVAVTSVDPSKLQPITPVQ